MSYLPKKEKKKEDKLFNKVEHIMNIQISKRVRKNIHVYKYLVQNTSRYSRNEPTRSDT